MSQVSKTSSQYIKSEEINKQIKKLNLVCTRMYRSQHKDGTIRMKYYHCSNNNAEMQAKLSELGLKCRRTRAYYGVTIDYIIHIK